MMFESINHDGILTHSSVTNAGWFTTESKHNRNRNKGTTGMNRTIIQLPCCLHDVTINRLLIKTPAENRFTQAVLARQRLELW